MINCADDKVTALTGSKACTIPGWVIIGSVIPGLELAWTRTQRLIAIDVKDVNRGNEKEWNFPFGRWLSDKPASDLLHYFSTFAKLTTLFILIPTFHMNQEMNLISLSCFPTLKVILDLEVVLSLYNISLQCFYR